MPPASPSRSTAASPRRAGYAMVALAATLWGSWTLALRPASLDPRWTSVIVFAAMTVVPAPWVLRAALRARRGRTAREWAWLALLGVSDAANVALFFAALARTTNAIAVLSHYLAPALVPPLAPLLLGTPFRRAALPRAALATAGLVLVLEPWALARLEPRHAMGAALGAASAVFYALNVCVTKRLVGRFSSEELLVYHSAVGCAALLAFAPWSAPPPAHGALVVLAAGVLVGVTAGLLFNRGVARVPAEHASVLTFLEPLTAVAIGALVFGERLGALTVVGGALVLGVGIAATRAE